jgi:hypothetical protein
VLRCFTARQVISLLHYESFWKANNTTLPLTSYIGWVWLTFKSWLSEPNLCWVSKLSRFHGAQLCVRHFFTYTISLTNWQCWRIWMELEIRHWQQVNFPFCAPLSYCKAESVHFVHYSAGRQQTRKMGCSQQQKLRVVSERASWPVCVLVGYTQDVTAYHGIHL